MLPQLSGGQVWPACRNHSQEDNNFVLYDQAKVGRWSTRTWDKGTKGQGRVVLGDDGVLRVLSGASELWSSKTVTYGVSVGGGSSKMGFSVTLDRKAAENVGMAINKGKQDVKKVLTKAQEDCTIM